MRKNTSGFIALSLIICQVCLNFAWVPDVRAEENPDVFGSLLSQCSDGTDNDGDGNIDMGDISCHTDWDVNNLASYNYDATSEGEDHIKRVPTQPDGTGYDAGSSQSTISADGNLIAYSSPTRFGTSPYYALHQNISVYNITSGETKLISATLDGKTSDGNSTYPVISSNGNYVVFQSTSENLVSDDSNNRTDIFVRDLSRDTITLVSRGMDGKSANGESWFPSIGGQDGKYIVFQSFASNLVPNGNGKGNIFSYNIDTKEIKCLSSAMDGSSGNGYSQYPVMSSGSNNVVFGSTSDNLVSGDVSGLDIFVRNLDTWKIELVSLSSDGKSVVASNSFFQSISSDGNFVTFASYNNLVPDDTGGWLDSFVYDRNKHSLEKIGVSASGEQGNNNSERTSFISKDGQFTLFSSSASNLVPGDNNGRIDTFVRNQSTHAIRRISITPYGAEIGYNSQATAITPDGKYILMTSAAGNLAQGVPNHAINTFIIRNPFVFGYEIKGAAMIPTDLSQKNESDGAEVGVGKIINEGAAESADSVILSAKVEDPDSGRVALEVQIESVDEVSGVWSKYEPIRSEYVSSGQVASINYTASKGGLYTWRARTVNEAGKKSEWSHFGDNGIGADFISSNFSFVFLTDVHLGSNMAPIAVRFSEPWYESKSYPRFTDVLYDIENLDPKPDFILIGGDNVEYNNERWLYDFKSITEGYSQRTGIEIYFVPGNHDRYNSESTAWSWGERDFSGGNDYLHNFLDVMGNPKNANSFFEGTGIMNLRTSGSQGLNQYNYYFNRKGFRFIGLDSGEDTAEKLDTNPEGSGLNGNVLSRMKYLVENNPDIPGVIFMHHPIYTGTKDAPVLWLTPDTSIAKEETKTDTGKIAEDGSITTSWESFIDLCNQNNVQLVLSGHEHNNPIFDKNGSSVNLSNWIESEEEYPLYLQTQSATKKDNHGYRVIEVKNGKAIPHEAIAGVKKYEKVYTDLNAESPLDFLAYDSDGNEITVGNDDKATMFLAKDSDRRIIYNDTDKSHFEVKNNGSTEVFYDLNLQKREEWAEPTTQPESIQGYRIYNKELCGGNLSHCNSFIAVVEGGDYKNVYFKDMNIKKNSSHVTFVDWDDFKVDRTGLSTKVEGVSFGVNGDYDNLYSYDRFLITIDLNSPGELRVFDKNGAVTGMVDGKIVEDIPYSMYIPESETVYIFGNTEEEVADGLKTQVVGAYSATYDLSITLSENDEEKGKFIADDILTNNQTTHQFSVDWEALERGENGVTVEFDESKDDVFEKSILSDGILSSPKAKLSLGEYSANEGAEIIFDASASSDSDGNITLYEWDFDGNGIYDATSVEPTIAYTYGDDFVGGMLLRVTDNEGLKSISNAKVIVTNANPTVLISRFEMAGTVDKNIFDGKYSGLEWLRASSNSRVTDAMGEFILEGKFTDSGWLDIHSASVDWGDGNMENIQVTEENISPEAIGKITTSHKYIELKNYVVKLTVTDDDGGTAIAEITLESPKQIKQAALLKLSAIQTDNETVRKEIDKAIGSLEESLESKYWQDDFHLDLSSAPKFFSEDKKAIKAVEKILEDKKKNESFQDAQEVQKIIDGLFQADVFLVKIMVYETDYSGAASTGKKLGL